MRSILASLIAVFTILSSVIESSGIMVYGDRPTFTAAVGGAGSLTVEDFTDTSHFPIITGILNQFTSLPGIGISPGDIQPGVTYSTPIGSSFFFNIDAGIGFVGGFLDGFYGGDPDRELTVTFDHPARAFGFDTNEEMGTDFDITINFSAGPDYVDNFAVSSGFQTQFFGFQSDSADIESVIIKGNADESFAFALDNFTFGGEIIGVPESSSSLICLGLALASLANLKRRGFQPAA